MKTFACITLGCKVNRYESEALSEHLEDRGWRIAEDGEPAGLCIVNTCTVTGKAAMQSRQAVRKTIRAHPCAVVVVTGCYAQTAPHLLASIPGVTCVVGQGEKHRIPEWVDGLGRPGGEKILVDDVSGPRPFQDLPVTRFGARTRAFVKIQDGCDAFCSYCIVPYARGRSRSLAPEVVTRRVETLNRAGYLEVVVSGIHVGKYGQDLTPATSLSALVKSLDQQEGAARIRLSSIEPRELTETMIRSLADSRHLCPHLHIPLQSGDDGVLEAMNRPYTAKMYRTLIQSLVQAIPQLSIGVDVMAGFPGETEQAFENTCRLIEELPVAYLHVFPFSLQKATAAARLPRGLSPQTIKTRAAQLRRLGQRKREAFYSRFLGSTQAVLVEGRRDNATGRWKGFTANYIPVLVQGDDHLCHRIVPVVVEKVSQGQVFGKPL